jgi:hypothetical protein
MLGDYLLKRGSVDPASTHPAVHGSIRVPEASPELLQQIMGVPEATLADYILERGSVDPDSTPPTRIFIGSLRLHLATACCME